jgi:hypothetical protein
MSAGPSSRAARRVAIVGFVVLAGATACLPLPTVTPSPTSDATPSLAPTPSPSETAEPSRTPAPTPEPYALANPSAFDDRRIRVTVAPNLATDASGTILVTVTNLDATMIQELVLRWSTELDEHLFLAPFTPSNDRICNGCPPLVQPWTKWVVGPGARGEPAGTTSLGWGPLLPAPATLQIPVVANRRMPGPVSFDLQILAGEALLTLEDRSPAWLRVSVP